jgi:hypothetical protein
MEKLLTRDEFRTAVFLRDDHKCVICKADAVDAHHIVERRLFPDGGYYLENGASVCATCHLRCEMTELSVEEVREAAGIRKIILPPEYYPDQPIDKWGNPILPDGRRMRGELFEDESVQKVLSMGLGGLGLFTKYVKYPRTWHLPWSPGATDDDRVLKDTANFRGRTVVVTEKMDGENTTMYSDYIHARSVDGRSHPSRDWVKNFHGQIAYNIPDGWRICGENLFAKHSIGYDKLPSFFMGFSVWNDRNVCLSWDETLEYMELMGIKPVPVLYRGLYNGDEIRALYDEKKDWEKREGYVIRLADSFPYSSFDQSVAKYVRSEHVRTTKHWMHGQPVEPNYLA